MTVTVDEPRIAWAHDLQTDPKLPGKLARDWLAANGVTGGRTVRVEILAGDPPVLRWWTIDPKIAAPGAPRTCCTTTSAVYRNHRVGPFTTPLTVALPVELTARDGST